MKRIQFNNLAAVAELRAGEMRATTGGHRYTWVSVGIGRFRFCKRVTYWPIGHRHPAKPSHCP